MKIFIVCLLFLAPAPPILHADSQYGYFRPAPDENAPGSGYVHNISSKKGFFASLQDYGEKVLSLLLDK